MRKLITFFAILLYFGCIAPKAPEFSPTSTYTHNPKPPAKIVTAVWPVYIDKRFSYAEKDAIHTAIYQWNVALNGYLKFDIVSNEYSLDIAIVDKMDKTDQGLIFTYQTTADPEVILLDDGVLAWVDELGGHEVRVVTDRFGTRDVALVMMHEIGHSLGLKHDDIRYTLMYSFYNRQPSCIDEITMLRIASKYNWDIGHLNYCPLDF